MISVELAPSQLPAALEALKDHPEATVTFNEDSKTDGHLHTAQIDADFNYQQRGNSGTLVLFNEKKHGMYGLVSDGTIGKYIVGLIGNLPQVDPAKPEITESKPEPVKIEGEPNGTNV